MCQSHQWRDWAGYRCASSYELTFEREYFAVRNGVGVLDVSPLFKYDITGDEALAAVNRIMTRDLRRCRVGQVMYSAWADEQGKVIQDGNVVRLGEQHFRVTAAEPTLRWFQDCAYGFAAQVTDVSAEIAALALQGPRARAVLQGLLAGIDADGLRYFRATEGDLLGRPVLVTRTGFTGDLGYELWIAAEGAELLWDRVLAAGEAHGVLPFGLVALDLLRIEAGLPLIHVDFLSAPLSELESRKSSVWEAGFGFTIDLTPGHDFVGRRALEREEKEGARTVLVGLAVEWAELERLYNPAGLRPQVVGRAASRVGVPVYLGSRKVGQATSHMFSPVVKQYLALASLDREAARLGAEVELEMTVEFHRLRARARVVKPPFFDPARKRTIRKDGRLVLPGAPAAAAAEVAR